MKTQAVLLLDGEASEVNVKVAGLLRERVRDPSLLLFIHILCFVICVPQFSGSGEIRRRWD